MGTLKQLLPWRGRPLVVHAVEAALASPCWPVVVVLGAEAERIRPVLARHPVQIAENPAWSEGMASSIRAGVQLLQQFSRQLDSVLIALCDQPGFSTATIGRLLAARENTRAGIVAARYAGRQGAPALFGREHFASLAALTGEEGARSLLNGSSDHVVGVDLPELALDLDTPADYARWSGETTAT